MVAEHDLIVVGMGVGGEEVAGRCAQAGMDVLGIERKLVGGECPYWGCIPSKMMVRAGNTLAEAARAVRLAGRVEITPDFAPVAARIQDATDGWDDRVAVERFEGKGGTFVRGEARLVDARTVEVGGERLRARRGVVLGTGGEPLIPPIDGLDAVEYWTNREAIESGEVPKSIVVIGGGVVGVELAQVYRRFGAEVTIVEMAPHLLPSEEPENGLALGGVLEAEGITVRTGIMAERVEASTAGAAVYASDGSVCTGERVLVAVGRSSDLERLGVRAAGLPAGRAVATDEHLRAGDGLWAVGDVTGVGQFTHLAVYQARIAAADILGRAHEPADYSAVPRVTFTDPEVASVGLSEAEARRRVSVAVGSSETASSARGWIHGPGAERGLVKLVADRAAGRLVGASVMGPAAGEVIGLLVLAIKARLPVTLLGELIYPYPTFVRGIEDALRALAGEL